MTIENNVLRGSLIPEDPGRDSLGTAGKPFKEVYAKAVITSGGDVFTDLTVTGVLTLTGASIVGASLTAPNIGVATGTSLQAIIGNVTPAAGTFTTLSASTSVDTPLHKAGGTSGVAGPTTLTVISSITVKGGIITAIAGT